MDYQGDVVTDIVALPVGEHVVGVFVTSQPDILPRIDSKVTPPVIPCCQNQHVIRTSDSVVVVEVEARMTVYPRTIPFSRVEEAAIESYLETLAEDGVVPTPEAYAKGLKAVTQRIACRMQQYGVEIV